MKRYSRRPSPASPPPAVDPYSGTEAEKILLVARKLQSALLVKRALADLPGYHDSSSRREAAATEDYFTGLLKLLLLSGTGNNRLPRQA
ncbi:MAG: hypothetical protein ACYC1I_11670 [Acidimicrobiales bacterium]